MCRSCSEFSIGRRGWQRESVVSGDGCRESLLRGLPWLKGARTAGTLPIMLYYCEPRCLRAHARCGGGCIARRAPSRVCRSSHIPVGEALNENSAGYSACGGCSKAQLSVEIVCLHGYGRPFRGKFSLNATRAGEWRNRRCTPTDGLGQLVSRRRTIRRDELRKPTPGSSGLTRRNPRRAAGPPGVSARPF